MFLKGVTDSSNAHWASGGVAVTKTKMDIPYKLLSSHKNFKKFAQVNKIQKLLHVIKTSQEIKIWIFTLMLRLYLRKLVLCY